MAFGSVNAERQAIEGTYEDTATVSRTLPKRGQNGISTSDPSVVYPEIVCGLSYTGSDSSTQTDAENNIDYDVKIFTGPDFLILPGDEIVVKRFGRDNAASNHLLRFKVVGRPAVYATHQEVKAKDGDLA